MEIIDAAEVNENLEPEWLLVAQNPAAIDQRVGVDEIAELRSSRWQTLDPAADTRLDPLGELGVLW
jgi:hypothetical protein